MRVLIYTVAAPLLTAMAFAQATPPAQTQPPAQPAAAATADKTTKDKMAAAPAEMKTQSYSGTLTDASCAAGAADSKPCPVSATTAQFALILKDGTKVKFDDVGNMRTQEAFKTHKKWTDAATASKPVRVKAGGIVNGDKMTVTSIN
jgi:hypothetical protein